MYPRSMLTAKIRKILQFYLKIIIFTAVKNHCVLHGRVFVMGLELHPRSPMQYTAIFTAV